MIDTTNNRGPLLNVAMWILLVPAALMVTVKVWTKWATTRKLQSDDYLMCIALLTAIANSIAITQEVEFGLGRKQEELSPKQIDDFQIAQYIGNIFYLLSIYTCKLSTICFFICICSTKTTILVVQWSIRTTAMWLFISLIVVLFQCGVPQPWNVLHGKCMNLRAFWIANLVMDLITHLMVGLLPIYLLKSLHTSKKSNKRLAMVAFTPNLLASPLAILRVLYLIDILDSSDTTWDSFNFILLTSFHAFIAVTVGSIPFAKPVIDSLIIQPYLIGDDALLTTLQQPNSKGSSWIRSASDSQGSKFRKNPQGFNSLASRNGSDNWPYTAQADEEDGQAVRKGDINLGRYKGTRHFTSVSAEPYAEQNRIPSPDEIDDGMDGGDRMVIHQTRTTEITRNGNT